MARCPRLIPKPSNSAVTWMEVDMKKLNQTRLVSLGRVSSLTRAIFDGKHQEPGSLIYRYTV